MEVNEATSILLSRWSWELIKDALEVHSWNAPPSVEEQCNSTIRCIKEALGEEK